MDQLRDDAIIYHRQVKTCTCCNQSLTVDKFHTKGVYRNKIRRDSRCKDCMSRIKSNVYKKKQAALKKIIKKPKRKTHVLELSEFTIERKYSLRGHERIDKVMSDWVEKVISNRMGKF